ncbi:MAG TPA: hypothetical protein PLB52_00310 [Candidatus Moranbacteria bacterium]|nr:hypothetical protein [Candidatus Moranbacteria bacterium]
MEKYLFEKAENEAHVIRDKALDLKLKRNESGEPSRDDYAQSEITLQEERDRQENGQQGPKARRKIELRKVFCEFKITIPADNQKEEQKIVFTDDEVNKIISNEAILRCRPETLKSDKYKYNFLRSMRNFNVSADEWKKCIFKTPQLFCQSPETIDSNIKNSAKLIGISEEEFIKAAIKHPSLFGMLPETINSNIENSAKLLGISREKFLNAALKRPSLLVQYPETINNNAENSAELLGIKKEMFIKSSLKAPQILYLNPSTINNNIESTSKLISIDKQEFLEVALKHPQLFYQSPMTIVKNIENSVEILGLSKEDFIKIALRQPSLFHQSYQTSKRNFQTLTMIFDNDIKETRNAILKMPASLTYSSERNIIHCILKRMTHKKYSLAVNPEEELKKFFLTRKKFKDWDKMQVIINKIKQSERAKK